MPRVFAFLACVPSFPTRLSFVIPQSGLPPPCTRLRDVLPPDLASVEAGASSLVFLPLTLLVSCPRPRPRPCPCMSIYSLVPAWPASKTKSAAAPYLH
ncbi:hypothetical protein FB451DRAFT_1282403, partial [Mycena latifolia]